MKLEEVTAVLRQRSSYEAVDLGFALTRDAGRAIWLPWFAATLPVCLLSLLAGWWLGLPWLGGLLIWWLKPLFDRIPLHVLSRRYFGETPGTRATLRAVPRLWLSALPAALLWSRLDFARSINLPVYQLEELRGWARFKRERLLQRATRGPAVWLTVMCLHLEAVLFYGVWVLVLMFVPFEYLPESAKALWAMFVENLTPTRWLLIGLLYYAAVSVVEPFYVGGGFALYLNRRTQLEGWDVEIALRRLAARLAEWRVGAAAALLATGLSLALLLPVPSAQAETAVPVVNLPAGDLPADADQRIQQAVDTAYRDPDLSPTEQIGHWQLKHAADNAAKKPEPTPVWLQTLAALLAWVVRNVLWLLALALLVVIWVYRRELVGWVARITPAGGAAPQTEVRARAIVEELPGDVPAAARSLWQAGQQRDALALLYRGGILRVEQLGGRPLPHGATETECLRAAERLGEAGRRAFGAVVRAWQYAAYAHHLPDTAAFDELVGLWQNGLGAPT